MEMLGHVLSCLQECRQQSNQHEMEDETFAGSSVVVAAGRSKCWGWAAESLSRSGPRQALARNTRFERTDTKYIGMS